MRNARLIPTDRRNANCMIPEDSTNNERWSNPKTSGFERNIPGNFDPRTRKTSDPKTVVTSAARRFEKTNFCVWTVK